LNPDLLCKAHQENVRIVWGVDYPVNQLTNDTHRAIWVDSLVQQVLDTYTDGINVDIEEPIAANSPEQKYLTILMQEATSAFHSKVPGSQVEFHLTDQKFLTLYR
jgi:di-N-acetylchitobiase